MAGLGMCLLAAPDAGLDADDAGGALLGAAVALVVLGVGFDGAGRGGGEAGLDLGTKAGLIGLDRQQVVGAGVADGFGDGAVGGDGVDRDQCATSLIPRWYDRSLARPTRHGLRSISPSSINDSGH